MAAPEALHPFDIIDDLEAQYEPTQPTKNVVEKSFSVADSIEAATPRAGSMTDVEKFHTIARDLRLQVAVSSAEGNLQGINLKLPEGYQLKKVVDVLTQNPAPGLALVLEPVNNPDPELGIFQKLEPKTLIGIRVVSSYKKQVL